MEQDMMSVAINQW